MIRNWAAYFLCAVSLIASAQSDTRNRIRSSEGTKTRVSSDSRDFDTFPSENSGKNSLDLAAQAEISAAIGQDQPAYHFVAGPKGFHADNAAHGIAAEFSPTGVDFRFGATHWGIALRGYGYGNHLVSVAGVSPRASANRLEYRRGDFTEWYVNGPLGVEQGFSIARPPNSSNGQPLIVGMSIFGDLTASVDAGARSLTLKRNNIAVLHYAGLRSVDASGRDLSTWLEVTSDQLRLYVDDRGAQYPLTIDPFTEGVKLTTAIQCSFGGICDDGKASTLFGGTIAISGDGSTVVVGAQGNNAAYVFVRPTGILGGWRPPLYFRAKLTASDNSFDFGAGVGISTDGNTIVVLQNNPFGNATSSAYVYAKPSNGWASSTETAKLTAAESNCCPGAEFFASISISGDGSTIVMGYQGSGAAYLFLRPGNTWSNTTQSAKLTPSDGSGGFGSSTAISGDGRTVFVSKQNFDDPKTYVFVARLITFCTPSGCEVLSEWSSATETAQLNTADENAYLSTSNDGSVLAVGQPDSNDADVYVRPQSGWANVPASAHLTPSDGGSFFGFTVSCSGDGRVIFVGSNAYNFDVGYTQGAVYGYFQPDNGWTSATEDIKLAPLDSSTGDGFGSWLALSSDGTTLAVGAPGATVAGNAKEGAAYVFTGSIPRPVASVSPSSLAFGSQVVSTTSAPQTVTLTNTGTAPLKMASVAVAGQFTSTQHCVTASPIAPGNSCSESVVFAPSSVGPVSGTLTFTDDSGEIAGSTQQVQLSGTGLSATTSTSITSVSPNPAITAQPVAVVYKVAAQSGVTLSPSGVVVVNASTGESCTGSAPAGSCAIAFATVGTRTLIASYGGDLNFSPSTSASVTELVNKAATATSVSSSLNPSFAGQSVTFTVTVAGTLGGNPSGSVILKDGSTTLTALTLPSSGIVTYSTTALAVGSHAISASYVGDANFLASSGAVTQVVKKNTTTTAVASSLNPSNVGQLATFTATVTSTTGGSIPDGESVTFKYGTTVLGTSTTTAGSASVATLTLPAGSDTVVATYAGDANFGASSGSIKQVVNKFATTTINTSSANPSTVSQAVTFTATVSSTAGAIPDGDTITFKYGATVLGTATTVSGSASVTVSTLPAGSDSIVAAYAGDPSFAASTGAVKQVVNKFPTAMTVSSSLNPSAIGQAVTFTVTVSSTGGSIPDGETITFKYGTTVLGTGTTSSGSASVSVSTLPGGNDSVVATYAGDPNFAASSGSVKQVVNKFATTTLVTSAPNPSTLGSNATLTATITSGGGAIPDGETVTFKFGTTVLGTGATLGGSASLNVTTLPTGSDTVVGTYAGDANFAASSGSVVQKVQ